MFDEARGLPWSLAVDDVDTKLDCLLDGEMPGEPASAMISTLLNRGWSRQDIKQGLVLLLECPWSTRCAEQLHASLSLMKRYHPDGGQESLMVRAGIHSIRLLLPELSMLQKKEQRCCDRLSRLSRRQPEKIFGRQ